jgi:hypothetical protein
MSTEPTTTVDEDARTEEGEAPDEAPRGPKPRLLAPLLASGIIALALERLEILHWFPAAVLFAILALFVFATEIRKAREAREAQGDEHDHDEHEEEDEAHGEDR